MPGSVYRKLLTLFWCDPVFYTGYSLLDGTGGTNKPERILWVSFNNISCSIIDEQFNYTLGEAP
jgi:hypothetical protein